MRKTAWRRYKAVLIKPRRRCSAAHGRIGLQFALKLLNVHCSPRSRLAVAAFTTLRSARPELALLAQMIIGKANQADQSRGIQKQMSPLLLASFVWYKFRTSNQSFREALTTDEGRPVTPLSVSSRPTSVIREDGVDDGFPRHNGHLLIAVQARKGTRD